jgi:hypothetical protein
MSRASTSYSICEKGGVDGREIRAKTRFALLPGYDNLKNFAEENRGTMPQAASAALAFSAIAWNAAGSAMARSDSTLRSTVMPDFARPLIKTL